MFLRVIAERLAGRALVAQAQKLQDSLSYEQVYLAAETLRHLEFYEQFRATFAIAGMQIVVSRLHVVLFVPVYLSYTLKIKLHRQIIRL